MSRALAAAFPRADKAMNDLLEEIEALEREAAAGLAAADRGEPLAAWHGDFLGRRGRLAQLMRRLGEAPAADRARLGRAANEAKRALEQGFAARQEEVKQRELAAALAAERVDVTLPGRPVDAGRLHPITQVLRDVGRIFGGVGFSTCPRAIPPETCGTPSTPRSPI